MTRKFKTLGLCLVAVFAMSAVAATAAQAEKFTSASYAASITGEQIGALPNEFEVTNAGVECGTATFSGTLAAASETLTITPNYQNCLVGGSIPATVDMNGCDYLFHATGVKTASVDVVCPTTAGGVTDKIVITVPATGCEIQVPEQNSLSTLHIHVEAGIGDVRVTVKVGKISYSQNAKCPGGVESEKTGIYNGEVTLKGNNGAISMD